MRDTRLYGYADVGRFGLGHSLMAWARCRLWCDDHGARMLASNWHKFRVGPWLRRERDDRKYHRLFEFPGYVVGASRYLLLVGGSRVEAEALDPEALPQSRRPTVVVFRNRLIMNEECYFPSIVGRASQVRSSLITITRPEYRPAPITRPHIALHVRMGDFREVPSMDALRQGAKNSRIPVRWYAGVIRDLRSQFGDIPAIVYSDADDEALVELLREPNVGRSPRQPSVTDMLSLAQAGLLISSGSGFSQWGAYLGDVPRVCFPGQRMVRVLDQSGAVDREPECESVSELDPGFLQHVQDRLRISCQVSPQAS